MRRLERFHDLDNLRALAMLAGVLFHAALAHSPLAQPFFPTADRAQSPWVDVFAWGLHLFRMPLFFIVAGFFAALLVQQRGVGGFLVDRLRRIALPFVLLWPLSHWAMSASTMHAAATVTHPSPLLILLRQAVQAGAPMPPPGTGPLWFLYYLLLFSVAVWLARNLVPPGVGAALRRCPTWAWLLALPVCLSLGLATVTAPHPAPESLLPQFWALAYFGSFFALGFLAFSQRQWLNSWMQQAPWLLAGGLLACALYLHLMGRQTWLASDPSATWPLALAGAFASVWMALACMGLGRRWLNLRHPLLRYLADASYWVFLAHLPVLLALQYALMDADWAWPLKLGLSTAITLAVCLVSYHWLLRDTRLGALLLGRGAPRPARPDGASTLQNLRHGP